MRTRWFPGMIREIFLWQKSNSCACTRDVAVNGLTNIEQRYEHVSVLGEGGFGIVRRGTYKKTHKFYAIKKIKEDDAGAALVRELLCYAIFEADATEALAHMHSMGVVHCDHKLANILICRSDAPGGFVGKVTDPGVWCGVGETRPIKMGTPGRVPLENVLSEIPAAPDQDLFAAAVDFCFIVLTPVLRTANDNVWTLPALITPEENARAIALHAQGVDVSQHWVCELLRKALSPNPVDRPDMQSFTRFLRGLATSTTAYVEGLVARLSGVGHPPLIEHPPVEAPNLVPALGAPAAEQIQAGGGHSGGDAEVSLIEQVHLAPPLAGAPHPEGDNHDVAVAVHPAEAARAGNSSAPPGSPQHAVDPPAEAAEAANPVMPIVEVIAAGGPSTERLHLAPPPSGASNAEGHDNSPGAAAPTAEAAHGGNISARRNLALHDVDVPAAAAEAANPVMPSMGTIAAGVATMERVHRTPSLVAASHPELGDNGAAATLPQADGTEAGSGLAPRGSALPVLGLDPSLEEIDQSADPLLQPFPVSPAKIIANHLAYNMRSLGIPIRKANAPPPVAARALPGQAYRGNAGDSGDGSGGYNPVLRPVRVLPAEVMANHMAKTLHSLGGGLGTTNTPPRVSARPIPRKVYRGRGCGGGGGGGGSGTWGRASMRRASRGVLPGNTGVEGRAFFIPGCCPSRTAESSFWERFWRQ
eukprot:jgi/Undpi1/1799/HiC_scaffold_12.g05186.m1